MLFLDGAYLSGTQPPVFRCIGGPSAKELEALLARIAERIGRELERNGLLVDLVDVRFLLYGDALPRSASFRPSTKHEHRMMC